MSFEVGTGQAPVVSYAPIVERIDPIAPLKRIFWGMLICLLDLNLTLKSGGGGMQFDIINDVIGTLLISIAIAKLMTILVYPRYAGTMRFVYVVSWLAVLKAVWSMFIFEPPPLLTFLLALVELAIVIAMFLLCQSVRWLAVHYELPQATESWRITSLLVGLLWLVPTAAGAMLSLILAITNSHGIHVKASSPGPELLLLLLILVIFTIPIIHFRISIGRLEREIQIEFASLTAIRDEQAGAMPMG